MAIIYFLVGVGATMFGAMAGLGGGIIIKPVLDFLGDYDTASIAVLSASTVFAMACISLISSTRSGIQVHVRTSLTIAVGSILGGTAGKLSFQYILSLFKSEDMVTVIQSFIIAILMCIIYIFVRNKNKIKTYEFNNNYMIVFIGFILGILAAFLGIGGGPLNVAILTLCFSMGAKESALNSIFIILFSQASALLLVTFTTGFSTFDLSMLVFMIPGGIIGGFLGSKVSGHVKEQTIEKIFSIGIVFIIVISIWNMVANYV